MTLDPEDEQPAQPEFVQGSSGASSSSISPRAATQQSTPVLAIKSEVRSVSPYLAWVSLCMSRPFLAVLCRVCITGDPTFTVRECCQRRMHPRTEGQRTRTSSFTQSTCYSTRTHLSPQGNAPKGSKATHNNHRSTLHCTFSRFS